MNLHRCPESRRRGSGRSDPKASCSSKPVAERGRSEDFQPIDLVLPGNYLVTEMQQAQRRQTSRSGGTYQVTAASGHNVSSLNFGNLDSASKSYVYQVYLDLLGRNVDPGGLASWSSQLDQGVTRQQVVASIQTSSEHRISVVQQ